ncbi:MAG TPA: phage tail protein, partial [Candidatus Limnocylindrales bacterium]|nr:phage tail protein [Candidatus Limnocylindrales bacterium]
MGLVTGKSGGNKSLAVKPNLLSALRVQTSSYGQVLPIVYGQSRLAGRLLWSGDFAAIPHTSTQKVGGKGLGSGGGNAISNTTYTYQSAVAIALCQGPIQNLHNVWDSKGKLTLLTTSTQFTVPGGGGAFTPPNDGRIFHSSRGVSRGDAFSMSVTDFGSDGTLTLSGTQQTPMVATTGTPAAGQYTVDPVTGAHNFSAADAGKVVTITYSYSFPDSNSNGQPQQKLNITLFPGPRPQTPWTYLTSRHAGQDLGYSGVAYVASSNMDLGESGTLPNLSFEVLGFLPFGAGITDAEPSAIISDLLASPFYGLSGAVPLDTANTLAQYRNFCVANGLFLSPVLDAQKPASEWINDFLSITNAAAVWSEGLLKIVPYGDTTAFGNGAVFIPNTAPIYDLTTNDLLSEVLVKRPSVADVKNSVSIEFVNRANDYNPEVAEDKDEAAIALYGLRKAEAVQAHMITTTTVAKFAANLLRKRSIEVRATFTFKLGWQFNLLEPMDLVTLTVPELGYSKKPVRITAIREDDSGTLEIEAEDFPWGSAAPTLYAQQVPGGFVPQANADPGSANAPIIFEANDRLSLTGNYEIWIGVCGSSPDWGGCSVWLSPDGNSYAQVGRIYGSARMGVLTASLPAGTDPDTTHTVSVDLTQSGGVLSSGTPADCENFRTLCYLDGELISYQTATLTGPSAYTLGTRLRRGVWGSPNIAHSAGAVFLRLDNADAVFVYEADPTLIGTTLFFKFTPFNKFGLMEQSLAKATAYPFTFNGVFGNSDETPANNAT